MGVFFQPRRHQQQLIGSNRYCFLLHTREIACHSGTFSGKFQIIESNDNFFETNILNFGIP